MKSEVYIQQELASDSRIHLHRGVWWKPSAPGVCKPVLPFHLIVPNDSKPKFSKSPVGYSHLVPPSAQCGRGAFYWVMEEDQLRAHCFDSQSHEKRKAISKARRSGLTFERISNLEPLWPALKEIAISMAARTGYGRPPSYYETYFRQWQRHTAGEFTKPNREWWGVFSEGRLGAYMYAYQVDDTMYLQVTKVHSDFMIVRASDMLYFSMLEYCRELPSCTRVNTGRGGQSDGVDRFKEALGFRKYSVGEYFVYNPVLALALRSLLRFNRRVRRGVADRGGGGSCGLVHSLYSHAITMAERVAARS